jgi:CBS domain-containing protein
MAVIDNRNALKGISVGQAMRRQVIFLPQTGLIENAIRRTIKYKVNAVLVTDAEGKPAGVVSKTDLMGAYYAGLPFDTPVDSVMVADPVMCRPEEPLESALEIMGEKRIHRLYAADGMTGAIVGVLAYPDIVGMLYRFCRRCQKNLLRRHAPGGDLDVGAHIRAGEVMTRAVSSFSEDDTLMTVIEGLSAYRFGAVLIHSADGGPTGVLSKTDLMTAYLRGIAIDAPAKTVMSSPVRSCSADAFLARVIHRMIFSDVHRFFVHGEDESMIVGVLTLTDAARVRSGSCRACLSSRILIGNR